MNVVTYADSPRVDKHGAIVHPVLCDACGGSGTTEDCPMGHTGACPCSTLAVPCQECQDGIVSMADCSCSLCEQVYEDIERERARAKRLADAAPDLLIACQLAADEIDDHYDMSEDMPEGPFPGARRVLDVLEAAIKKAVAQ